MADNAYKGRTVLFAWKAAPVLGVQEKGLELNGAPIDVSSDDSNGWRVLLSVSAQDEVNVTISGISKDNVLKTDWFNGARTGAVSFTYPDGGIIAGTFFLASWKEKGPFKDAVSFEATLNSSGAVTYTPGT